MQKAIHGITVAHFFEAHGEQLKLELVTGADGLGRMIHEGTVNRPALALTGFFKYFANKRPQVFGAAEMSYLKTRTERTQLKTFRRMAAEGIPCFILTRNYQPTPALLTVAREERVPLFRSPLITMTFVNLATLCLDGEFAPRGTEHGTMLDIKGVGVLIRGDSGVGKSECALALIERGHSLVADDFIEIKLLDERELMATPRALNRGYMECRGLGIIDIGKMFGVKSIRSEKRIDLVVSLRTWKTDVVEERTGLDEQYFEILGKPVPHIQFFVRPGRDIGRLVEVAALTQALKKSGHDPAHEFNERLIASMSQQAADGAPVKIRPIALDPPTAPTAE
ncbi:MAG: HPr kinase/phosphorylase [Verrucomicrobiota bacterium]|jgi:HPr kinase/phosphorylase